jgi:hypothetical protein
MTEKRTVAWNPHSHDEVGVVWCCVTEDKPGYMPMTGRGEGSSPWYLAKLENHTDENGKVDYPALWENAEKTCDSYNEQRLGLTRKEVTEIVASSMRAQREQKGEKSFDIPQGRH